MVGGIFLIGIGLEIFIISRYQGGNKWNYTKKNLFFDWNVMPPCDWYR